MMEWQTRELSLFSNLKKAKKMLKNQANMPINSLWERVFSMR